VETPGWRAAIDGALHGLGAAAGARLGLLRLEARHALRVAVAAIVALAAALLLLATAWFALIAALVAWAVLAGFEWPWVLLAVSAACIVLGAIAVASARSSVARIRFDASTRAFGLSPLRAGPDLPANPAGGSR
jgi:hypothetical protein